jgi:hypothetical protein
MYVYLCLCRAESLESFSFESVVYMQQDFKSVIKPINPKKMYTPTIFVFKDFFLISKVLSVAVFRDFAIHL